MKAHRIFIAITALAALFLLEGSTLVRPCLASSCCGQKKKEAQQAPAEAGPKEMKGTTCPVMGGTIDKKYRHVHDGTTYYFCCTECIGKFKAEPEKYIKKTASE